MKAELLAALMGSQAPTGMNPFIPSLTPEKIKSHGHYAKSIHARKKGPGRSKGMKPKQLGMAGSKLARKFASGINTLQCKTRHDKKD